MLLWLIRALPLKQLNNLLGILLMTGVWSVTWLLLLQFELAVTGSTTGTYGSDATYYYEAMYAGYFSDNPTQAISAYYNQLYIWFGIIILKTSPFFSIIWVKIGNILLLLYVISMIYLMLYQKGAPRQVTNFVCLFSGLNGIVTWMCIRNLKDTLFLFLLVFTCYLAFDFYRKYTSKKPGVNILRFLMLIVLFIIFSHCFQNIRQWAYIIPWLILISLLVRIILNNKFPNKYILILGVGIVLLLSIIYFIIGGDVMNYFRTYASVSGLGDRTGFGLISGLVISLLRFIIGPGPFRAIMGNDVFLVTTNIGNTLIFLGSLMWWLVIPLMVLRIKELIRIIPKEHSCNA